MALDLLAQAVDRFGLFWLIVGRVSGLFFMMPVFSNRFLPAAARVWLVLLVSALLLPVTPEPPGGVPADVTGYAAAFARELAFGLGLGFLVSLVFHVAEVAGQLLDVDMGFSMMNVIDPVFGHPMPVMGNFLNLLTMLLFLVVDGHHLILSALAESFRRLSPGLGGITDGSLQVGIGDVAWMFVTAVKIAAPVLGILFLATVVMGLMARATPQLNIFVVGLPVKLAVGLVGLTLALPVYVLALRALFPHAYKSLSLFLEAVVPS